MTKYIIVNPLFTPCARCNGWEDMDFQTKEEAEEFIKKNYEDRCMCPESHCRCFIEKVDQ